MQHRLNSLEALERVFALSDDELQALREPGRQFPVSLTPYYASLLSLQDAENPLRKTMIPVPDEFKVSEGEYSDPLGEDKNSPVPSIVHKYIDRALFLVTDHCPIYCRYCTRSRLVGGNADFEMTKRQWQKGIDYIAAHSEIHDVLISGGDPLIFSDAKLEWLLKRLSAIPHLDYIRIGSKIPVAMPMRITDELCQMLKKYHPLFMSIHITHPAELTSEGSMALQKLAEAGIPLGSQTVLLKGVNDEPNTMLILMRKLLQNRVKPYYLLQCDPILGSTHFRTPVEKGIEILEFLRGKISGYGIPQFILDIPEGGGKIPLVPEYIEKREENYIYLKNYAGIEGFTYFDG